MELASPLNRSGLKLRTPRPEKTPDEQRVFSFGEKDKDQVRPYLN